MTTHWSREENLQYQIKLSEVMTERVLLLTKKLRDAGLNSHVSTLHDSILISVAVGELPDIKRILTSMGWGTN